MTTRKVLLRLRKVNSKGLFYGLMPNNNPIGIFDSGIGGLTVLREISKLLPNEKTVYLGDTARVPYGSKSKETVIRYSVEDAAFLVRHNIKLLVVACNTASAFALSNLREKLNIPVIGVIEPGAKAAVKATKAKNIGVIGTEGTIRSNAYSEAIRAIDPEIKVFSGACPLFVPLAEEGWTDNDVTALTVSKYLGGLKDKGIDSLVLGCTHYPLLKSPIARFMGSDIKLIDSAEATAAEVKLILESKGLLNNIGKGSQEFFVTDSPERFVTVGRRFFGEGLERAEVTQLEGLNLV